MVYALAAAGRSIPIPRVYQSVWRRRWPLKRTWFDILSLTMNNTMSWFFPITPAGTVLATLKANTEEQAWANLLRDVGELYPSREELERRGYTVEQGG